MNQPASKQAPNISYRLLVALAIGFALLSLGALAYQYFSTRQPGELTLRAADQFFEDGHYLRADKTYHQALIENEKLPAAFSGLANCAIQTKRFDEALENINKAISLNPNFGGYFVTKGLIYDHLKQPQQAMKMYKKALDLYPEAGEPMGWLDRLLYKVETAPPTIKERLAYLKAQMLLPPNQRKLYNKNLDGSTRPIDR